jgi:hypothetical protein
MFFQNSTQDSTVEDKAALLAVIEKGMQKAEKLIAKEANPQLKGSAEVQLAFVHKKLGKPDVALTCTPAAIADYDTELTEKQAETETRTKKLEENRFIQFLHQAGDVVNAKKRLQKEIEKARSEKILGPGMLRDLADIYILIGDKKTASALLHESYLKEKEELDTIPTKERTPNSYTSIYLCLLTLTDLGEDAFVEPRVAPLSLESRAMISRNKARRLLGAGKPTAIQQAAALPFLDKAERYLVEYSTKNKKEASVGYFIPLLILWHRAGRPERAKTLFNRLPQIIPLKNKAEKEQLNAMQAQVCAATGDVATALAITQKSPDDGRLGQYLDIIDGVFNNEDFAGYKRIEPSFLAEAKRLDKKTPGILQAMQIVATQVSGMGLIQTKQYKEATTVLKDFENGLDKLSLGKPTDSERLSALIDFLVKLAIAYADEKTKI